jgi:uncharacterized protein YecE (DUF72 family)
MSSLCRIGTSGWVYAHWREVFYPQTCPCLAGIVTM